ncbi:hypothetical protein [Acetobacter persici]|uniref:Uncharacterized protein n=1 Tax=Acetobacter persici TaxID=1076596 RepID=A0A6V8IAQ7_9PROT|nr:hypothetical protein [Acetobacter persici]OUI91013.1 hypothetical protein HK19_08300 [Acetobacter persici]GFE94709.1 hypothetical protein DmAi_27680 [Acetobacter persici]
MKIRFAVVRPDLLKQVRAEVEGLLHAVNVGDMDGVDMSTKRLMGLTVYCTSIDLSEQEWRTFLDGIRVKNPEFESSYLLPGIMCAPLFPQLSVSGEYVLELPIYGDLQEENVNV